MSDILTDILDDIGHPTWLSFSVIAARLALAALLGAVIGFEREWRRHPAGLRTHTLVCLAAAVIAVLTVEIVHSPQFAGQSFRFDPIRLVEAVTAGVAFLAAGLIIFNRGRIKGLTTGAGMWLAAAIGLACGLGFWQIAGLATLMGLIALSFMQWLEVPDPAAAPPAGKEDENAGRNDDGQAAGR